jgi:hypothetical protein
MSVIIITLGDNEHSKIRKIIDSGLFEKVIILKNSSVTFVHNGHSIDCNADNIGELHDLLMRDLKSSLAGMNEIDVAINISSGKGIMHAALLSALMKLGFGIRLIEVDKDGDVVVL